MVVARESVRGDRVDEGLFRGSYPFCQVVWYGVPELYHCWTGAPTRVSTSIQGKPELVISGSRAASTRDWRIPRNQY